MAASFHFDTFECLSLLRHLVDETPARRIDFRPAFIAPGEYLGALFYCPASPRASRTILCHTRILTLPAFHAAHDVHRSIKTETEDAFREIERARDEIEDNWENVEKERRWRKDERRQNPQEIRPQREEAAKARLVADAYREMLVVEVGMPRDVAHHRHSEQYNAGNIDPVDDGRNLIVMKRTDEIGRKWDEADEHEIREVEEVEPPVDRLRKRVKDKMMIDPECGEHGKTEEVEADQGGERAELTEERHI